MKKYEFDAMIRADAESGGAYVAFPWDLRAEFGKGRLKVHAAFDGIPYDGSIVNMGVKNEDGSVCYVIGILKAIRTHLGKGDGDTVHVVISPAGSEQPFRKFRMSGSRSGKHRSLSSQSTCSRRHPLRLSERPRIARSLS